MGGGGKALRLRIVNAGGATYADAWNDYQACASYDLQDWFRFVGLARIFRSIALGCLEDAPLPNLDSEAQEGPRQCNFIHAYCRACMLIANSVSTR